MTQHAAFTAAVSVTENDQHWDAVVSAHTENREHQFEYSYAKNNWSAAEAGAEALIVIVDRVNRGAI